jgi:amino acid adenylation domain-containing protein
MSSSPEDLSARRARLSPQQLQRLQQRLAGGGPVASASSGGDADRIPRQAGNSAPATAAQRGLWFLWRVNPASTAYHVGGGLGLEGPLNVEALQSALAQVVSRHDALRVVFRAEEQDQLLQVMSAERLGAIPSIDLAHCDEAEREHRRHQAVQDVLTAPFDLTQGPLMQVVLLRLAPQRHQLLLCLHHAISDAWSVDIVLRELAAAYACALNGAPFALPQPEIRFLDFAQWQQRWQGSPAGQRQLDYWRSHLGNDHTPLQLPTDRPRGSGGVGSSGSSSANEGRAASVVLDLPATLTLRLRDHARQHQATLFMGLAAAFHALLFRYTGQSRIRSGLPVANRERAETAAVVGFLTNTVVLQSEVSARLPLSALLEQVRDTTLSALAHQELPFECLVEALKPPRQGGASPLFQVLFNHLRVDGRAVAPWPGLRVEPIDFGERQAPFELTLETVEAADGQVRAHFRYASHLFDRERIERMAGHYLALLEALVTHPQQAVGEVPLLTPHELAQLDTWAQHTQFRSDDLIHRRFESQAARQPAAVALVLGDQTLSYGALNRRANRLAHQLIARGVRPEDRVGLSAERAFDMVVGMLAILKAGASYVPLDPAYPAERLAYMVQDSGVALVLTDAPGVDDVLRTDPGAGSQGVPTLSIRQAAVADGHDFDPKVLTSADSLAYVIYTSGSTGRPKGAQLTHRNVVRLLDASADHFHFGVDDVWTLFHSYAFDFSVWELFGALCSGGRVVIVPHLVSRSPDEFLALLCEQRVTVLNQTPSAFKQLMQVAVARQATAPTAPGAAPTTAKTTTLALRLVIFGGEALEPRSLQPWADRFGLDRPALINMYGITETTVHVTWHRLRAADLAVGGSPIGQALPDLGLRILDSDLQPVPIGVPGELHVFGDGLARGYLNRPALTAERFIADPTRTDGGRLYRTGDLACWRSDGGIDYLGRIDEQVKLRGFRIELGEIEARLLAQPGVRQAAVVVDQAPAGPRLVAFVTVQPGHGVTVEGLRRGLTTCLPEHMVPAVLQVLDAIPLNANGKLDRRALPMPQAGAGQAGEPPQGAVEITLAAIWAEVLGLREVTRDSDFFELGGHSLALVQVQAQAEKRLGARLELRQWFELRTVAGQAAALSALQSSAVAEVNDMDRLMASLETLES